MRYIYIVFACGVLGFISCNNAGTVTTSASDSTKTKPVANTIPAQSKLSDAGTQKLMTVINQYYTLKNALVATKAGKADSEAATLAIMTDSLQAFLHTDSTAVMVKTYLDTIATQGKAISTIQDATCEKQRAAFSTYSGALYGLLKNVTLKNAVVYEEHCPMALEEKGAYWLSDDSDIKNPYMGKKMIECGEVTDVIR